MTKDHPPLSDDEDLSYEWTTAQMSISQAFKKGLVDVRLREVDGTTVYRPLYLSFTTCGEITIVLDNESATYI